MRAKQSFVTDMTFCFLPNCSNPRWNRDLGAENIKIVQCLQCHVLQEVMSHFPCLVYCRTRIRLNLPHDSGNNSVIGSALASAPMFTGVRHLISALVGAMDR